MVTDSETREEQKKSPMTRGMYLARRQTKCQRTRHTRPQLLCTSFLAKLVVLTRGTHHPTIASLVSTMFSLQTSYRRVQGSPFSAKAPDSQRTPKALTPCSTILYVCCSTMVRMPPTIALGLGQSTVIWGWLLSYRPKRDFFSSKTLLWTALTSVSGDK